MLLNTAANYWSSSEYSATNARNVNSNNGNINNNNKNNNNYVRAFASVPLARLRFFDFYFIDTSFFNFLRFVVEYVSYNELFYAYIDCRKRKRGTANENSFEICEAEKLYKLYIELNNFLYEVGRSICFIVDKPVPREIFAADFRDRIVHHLFINRILPYIEEEMIDDSYSCRKGKGTQYAVQKCAEYVKECSENYTKDCFILKCDLKQFFVTINKNILADLLSNFLINKCAYKGEELRFMVWLMELIVFNDPTIKCIIRGSIKDWDKFPKEKSLFNTLKHKGIPIGNLTSQIFANFYLCIFDHFIKEVLGFKYYGRYVDDFFIISDSKEKLLSAIDKIKEHLLSVEAILHPKKIYIQHYTRGIKFVGHVIKPGRIYIGNRIKGNFYEMLFSGYSIFINNIPTAQELQTYISCVNSYLGFMKHYNTYYLRKKMLKCEYILPFYHYGVVNCEYNKLKVYGKIV